MNDKKQIFLDNLPLLKPWGWNTDLCLAHAIHETNDFQHLIGEWNCWGMKVPHSVPWHGLVVYANTHEVMQGKTLAVNDAFVDFPDVTAALAYYDSFIHRVYPMAWKVRGENGMVYVQELFNGGYATDPHYIASYLARYNALQGGQS